MDLMLTIVLGLIGLLMVSILVVVVWGILSFNRLRALEARCDQARGDVDVQLKRRGDLLPNLTETVRGFVGQETHLLDTLADIQKHITSHASIATRANNNANVVNALSNVFQSLDQIPELRSSPHYVNLRAQILDTEDKVEAARRFLNLATAEFNTSRSQFPGALVAAITKIGERDGYDLGDERIFYNEAPSVKLT